MEEIKMPNMDKTGPQGLGPMTGRGLGPCGGGMRRGMGRRCWGKFPFTTSGSLTKEEETKILEAELQEIESEKKDIEKRLKEIK
jgi:hypothetical protein